MSEIQYIHNVTAGRYFLTSPGVFTIQLTGLPDINPDEVIVRAINFNSIPEDKNLYLIWSNIKNDYIGSFCGGKAPHFPQTRIWLNGPVPNMLEFKLYTRTGTGVVQIPSLSGEVSIHLDFIKYKRVRPHA
jgi:hypothetical protein